MAPDPERLRFFFDESALGVGKALTVARKDAIHAGHAPELRSLEVPHLWKNQDRWRPLLPLRAPCSPAWSPRSGSKFGTAQLRRRTMRPAVWCSRQPVSSQESSVHALIPEIPYGTEDVNWMPVVASRGLVAVLRDRRIRTKPAELDALRAHGLRVFWIAGKKDLSNWDALVRLVRRWPEVERVIDQRPRGPWFMAITEGGLTEIALPNRRAGNGPSAAAEDAADN